MYVRCNPNRKNVKYLSYVQGYRDKNGKAKQITVEKIGNWEDLIKLYDDPIKHFNDLAPSREKELLINNEKLQINFNEKLPDNFHPMTLGYCFLKKIYNEFKIKDFFKIKNKDFNIKFDLNDVFELLVYSRILNPASKLKTYNNKDQFFDNFDFSEKDMYRALTYLSNFKNNIELLIWENTKKTYNRDTSCCYYDCTNYYFEIEYNDEDVFEIDENGNPKFDEDSNPILKEQGLRKRGPEKNHRPDPIIGMGLLMDAAGFPITYDLFAGNESEKNTLLPIAKRTKNTFNVGRTIIVADRGLNTSDNIILIAGTSLEQAQKMNGYVYGQSVRGADKEFKDWVLKNDYKKELITDKNGEEILFVHKSRIYPKTMYVTRDDQGKTKSGNNKRQKILVDQKQMVYYSDKYAQKQKNDRNMMVEKAKDLIKNPNKYNKATSYGAAGYINNLKFIKSTGEIADTSNLSINEEKIKEEEKFDGYYSIVTSEEHLSDLEIRNIYKGLAKIEETFKITKTELETRPVYVRTRKSIEGHFLTCFVALVILRLLEFKLDGKYSLNQTIHEIKNLTCSHIKGDKYTINYRSPLIRDLESIFNLDFSNKYTNLKKIRVSLK